MKERKREGEEREKKVVCVRACWIVCRTSQTEHHCVQQQNAPLLFLSSSWYYVIFGLRTKRGRIRSPSLYRRRCDVHRMYTVRCMRRRQHRETLINRRRVNVHRPSPKCHSSNLKGNKCANAKKCTSIWRTGRVEPSRINCKRNPYCTHKLHSPGLWFITQSLVLSGFSIFSKRKFLSSLTHFSFFKLKDRRKDSLERETKRVRLLLCLVVQSNACLVDRSLKVN